MQVVAISEPQNSCETQLLRSHHHLRAKVFADRLGWEVEVVDGLEHDNFDTLHPTYILAIADTGGVVGCARLLPATGPTMLRDVFPTLLPNQRTSFHPSTVESSRFAVDTSVGGERAASLVHEATLTMFAGIIEWSLENGYSEIVTVTDLRFERILSRVGWPLQRLGAPQKIGITRAVAGTLSADRATFQRLRPAAYCSMLSNKLQVA